MAFSSLVKSIPFQSICVPGYQCHAVATKDCLSILFAAVWQMFPSVKGLLDIRVLHSKVQCICTYRYCNGGSKIIKSVYYVILIYCIFALKPE